MHMMRLLDTKIVFHGQGNLDPSLRYALVFILVFVVVIVGAGLGVVVRFSVKLLDIFESSAPASIERLGGYGPDAINCRKLPQDFILAISKEGFCATLNSGKR